MLAHLHPTAVLCPRRDSVLFLFLDLRRGTRRVSLLGRGPVQRAGLRGVASAVGDPVQGDGVCGGLLPEATTPINTQRRRHTPQGVSGDVPRGLHPAQTCTSLPTAGQALLGPCPTTPGPTWHFFATPKGASVHKTNGTDALGGRTDLRGATVRGLQAVHSGRRRRPVGGPLTGMVCNGGEWNGGRDTGEV